MSEDEHGTHETPWVDFDALVGDPWGVCETRCPCGELIVVVAPLSVELLAVYFCSACRARFRDQEHTRA